MKKNNLRIVKINKSKSLFNYEKKILINELSKKFNNDLKIYNPKFKTTFKRI